MASHLHLAAVPGGEQQPAIRVVLADDHLRVRRSLRLLLDGEAGLEVVSEASDLAEATRLVHGQLPHVLVLDLQLPNGSCIETIRQLRRDVPRTEIVVLTMEDSALFALQTINAGAIGYVLKHKSDAELPMAVRLAARGEEFVSDHVAAGLDALRSARGDRLSPRETEVLRLIALGYTSAEIADKLGLSRRTIDTHRIHIHRKLGLQTRAELVRYALKRHLLADE